MPRTSFLVSADRGSTDDCVLCGPEDRIFSRAGAGEEPNVWFVARRGAVLRGSRGLLQTAYIGREGGEQPALTEEEEPCSGGAE
ncbi:unnamed protein product [Boreogadus saida]